MNRIALELPRPRLELRQAILLSGRTAWQVAWAAGISESTLSRIGTGRRMPSAEEVEMLAHVLGTEPTVLFPDFVSSD